MTKYFSHNLILIAVIVFAWGLLDATAAQAETVVRTGDEVSIAGDQTIEGDLYSAAGKVNISGVVNEDVMAAGGQITVNGKVGNDALLIGGNVDTHGPIGDDLRVIAGEVTIADVVTGDVFIIGGAINILSTASITGDVILFGSQATIEGSVGGNILGTVDQLRIDAPVAGKVDITVSQLALGDKANITGSVRYISTQVATQALNAVVGGDLVRNDPVIPVQDVTVRSTLIPVLILLFSTLVWYLVSRKTLNLVVERALVKSPRPMLVGFATFLLAPVVMVALIVSMIGSLVGLVLLFGYLLFIALSLAGVVAVLGQLLMKIFNRPTNTASLLSLVVGVVAIIVLMLLPLVGQAIILCFIVLTFGALVDLLFRPRIN